MASVTNKDIKKALTPWNKVEREFTDDPNYYNRTEQEWIDHNKGVLTDTVNTLNGTRDVRSGNFRGAVERLVDREGYERNEAGRAVKKVMNNPSDPLIQVKMGVPHANADERLSALVLKLQGFDNVKLANHNPVTGTDLRGSRGTFDITDDPFDQWVKEEMKTDPFYLNQLNGNRYADYIERGGDPTKVPEFKQIDAQTRLSPQRSLNLGVMMNTGRGNAERMWRQAPGDKRFVDFLDELKSNAITEAKGYKKRFAGQDDKLLQTLDWLITDDGMGDLISLDHLGKDDIRDFDISNAFEKHRNNPNDPYNDQWDDHQKDYLITSERPAGGSKIVRNAGPYNPTLPEDWSMLNLQAMRQELIGDSTMSQIRDMGIEPNSRASDNGSLKITIPKDQFTRWDEKINPIVKEVLTRKKGRR